MTSPYQGWLGRCGLSSTTTTMPSFVRSSLFTAAAVASAVYASPLSTNPSYNAAQRTQLDLAPLSEESLHGHIENSYIVTLKNDVPVSLMANHMNFLEAAHESDPLQGSEGGIKHVYDSHILKGYAGSFTDDVVSQIRRMPEVAHIERDQIVKTLEVADNSTTQTGAPWVSHTTLTQPSRIRRSFPHFQGLARISHRKRLSFGTFNKYNYIEYGGEGVDVYVIDTGINVEHEQFEGRASWGKTIPQNDVDEDGNGHGSHCAGTIASKKYGVAKQANVIAVKVLGSNGSGSMSDVVAGVEFAASAAAQKAEEAAHELATTGKTKHKGSVANMSLGGGKSPSLDMAVNAAVDAGVHFAVAAGTFLEASTLI